MEADISARREFRVLFEEHYGHVLAYARRRTTDAADADDVVAETFAIAWRKFREMPEEPLPWLYGVARRVLANHRRGRNRWLSLIERIRREPPDIETPRSSAEPVRIALSKLKPADQEVLRLSAWEELSHAQIGQVLGITANAAAIRVHRARKQLGIELAALGFAPRNTEPSAGHSVG